MHPLRVSSRAFEALSANVRAGFEQRLTSFLKLHAPNFRHEQDEAWRGYERSARKYGLVAEQEIALYVFGCYVLGDDIDRHETEFLEEVSNNDNVDHRLLLMEERILAYELAREMAVRS